MKRIILILMVLLLAGCGSGSDGNTSSTQQAPPPAASKTSIVDGTWKSNSAANTYFHLYTYVTFSNGNIDTFGFLGDLNLSKEGTFTVNGDILSFTLTRSYTGQNLTSIDDLSKSSGTITSINESETCTVSISNNIMTLVDNTNPQQVAIFTKQ